MKQGMLWTRDFGVATSMFFLASDTGLGIGPTAFGTISHVAGYSGMYVCTSAMAVLVFLFYPLLIANRATKPEGSSR